MTRPDYLQKYMFDWNSFDVVLGGQSSLDSDSFIKPMTTKKEVNSFLKGYGIESNDPVARAELFGNFQEAIQFIKRYFLIEGNRDGLELTIPNFLFMITDINELFLTTTNFGGKTVEEKLWAEIVLKVMHTIMHVDKDIRANYFSVIQTQIFDRFYHHIHRDDSGMLNLGVKGNKNQIPLIDFSTKAKKSRDSVIIKLLHKPEHVAEELFDRVGVRIVTQSRFDTLRAVKFLIEKNIMVPHNIKPSRSINTMVDLGKFKPKHLNLIKMAIRNNLSEDRFISALEREITECLPGGDGKNKDNSHSNINYQTFQFTCRQLIRYKNPFFTRFKEVREEASEKYSLDSGNELAKKILDLDHSMIARDIRFFYPFEVQIVDQEAQYMNTQGNASHQEYKRSQVISSRDRVFLKLMKYKGI